MAELSRDSTGAPKAGGPSAKSKSGMAKFFADAEAVKKAKEQAKTSVYYDYQSPSVRARRKMAQQEFEWFVNQYLGKEDAAQSEIWNIETFTEYTKLWLSCCATFIEGRISTKPKAGVLFQRKDALYWWAIRKMDNFTQIYGKWHAECVGLIAMTADLAGFEKSSLQKNTLSDTDLALFFQALTRYSRGRDNWKQNYVMWVLVYLTGIRPGSFTVAVGYEKGAALGDGRAGAQRVEDETFRWSDCEFKRTEDGTIVAKATFRYLKGHRNANTPNYVAASKSWTFVPSRSNRYEFDMALLLTATAFSRGLFKYDTIEELMNGEEVFLPLNEDVNKQAVFLGSGAAEKLIPSKPMRVKAVNDKLKVICKDHGYFGRNTIYALRRTALIEVKRKHGTEFARETATHVPEGNTIYAYDVIGQSDIDWTADRLDQAGLSRKQLSNLYSQQATAKIDVPAPATSATARSSQLDARVDAKVFVDESYIKAERDLLGKIKAIADRLKEPELDVRNVQHYRILLVERGTEADTAELAVLDGMLKKRRESKRSLRKKYEKEVKQEMLADHRKNMKISREGARPKLNVLKDQRVDSRSVVNEIDARIENEINNLTTTETDENEIDINAINEQDDLGEGDEEEEHDFWTELPNNIELQVNLGDEDGAATDAGRIAFMRRWVQYQSTQNSGLICVMCGLDDTVGEDRKNKLWTLQKLDAHLKGEFHSREEQLVRAFHLDRREAESAPCPLCGDTLKAGTGRFNVRDHLKESHPEQLL